MFEDPQDLDQAVEFEVLGRPQQRGSKTAVRNRMGEVILANGNPILKDCNDKSIAWMDSVRVAANEAWGWELLEGPLALEALFRFRRPKSHYGTGRNAGKLKKSAPIHHAQTPDLAKLVRALEDALTGVVWRDDKQVVEYLSGTRRVWTNKAEGAYVRIYRIGG